MEPRSAEAGIRRKPKWIRTRLPGGPDYEAVRGLVAGCGLHTVCQSARCPNIGECWARRAAAFLLLGNVCTRHCAFCAVDHGQPAPPDPGEPRRVAEAVKKMGLRHAVITSVTRDDLPGGGAHHWAAVIREVRRVNPGVAVEALVPDFGGREPDLDLVLDTGPAVLNHNVETVQRLQKSIRRQANWEHSLRVLRRGRERGFATKSGLMLGLGERREEVADALRELRAAGTRIVTLGQYLRPGPENHPVARWVTPEEFAEWRDFCLSLGFEAAESRPLARSSYHADKLYQPD